MLLDCSLFDLLLSSLVPGARQIDRRRPLGAQSPTSAGQNPHHRKEQHQTEGRSEDGRQIRSQCAERPKQRRKACRYTCPTENTAAETATADYTCTS